MSIGQPQMTKMQATEQPLWYFFHLPLYKVLTRFDPSNKARLFQTQKCNFKYVSNIHKTSPVIRELLTFLPERQKAELFLSSCFTTKLCFNERHYLREIIARKIVQEGKKLDFLQYCF